MAAVASFAQKQLQDANLWQGVGMNIKLSKKWTLSLEEQVRFKLDVAQFDEVLTEVAVRRKITNWFKLDAAYRFSFQEKESAHRFTTDAIFGYKFDSLNIQIDGRVRGQYNIPTGPSAPDWTVRPRITVSYSKKKSDWAPFILVEPQWSFSTAGGSTYDRIRIGAGTDFALNKYNTLGFTYLFQKPYDGSEPITHIFSLAFILRLGFDSKDASERQGRD